MIPWYVSDEAIESQTGYVPMGQGPGITEEDIDADLIIKNGSNGEGWDQVAGKSGSFQNPVGAVPLL